MKRKLPIGAELCQHANHKAIHFRVWAPNATRVTVVLESGEGSPGEHRLTAEDGGYFSSFVGGAAAGTLYRFTLDESIERFADPAARFQPNGPHGSSEVVDPGAFTWSDDAWRGVARDGQVLYELHVGTFTPEGTWQAATDKLEWLAALGVTVIEVMPVADFPGRFGWGYDGVLLFAPTWLYGRPDDFRQFVNTAHGLGLGVILDVVYNHFGPDGNFFERFAYAYFTDRYQNEWGRALNFDGPDAGPVREYFCANAAYWVDEFHLDGLRLDATQQIFDSSRSHIIADVVQAARRAAGSRLVFLVGENEPQDASLVRPQSASGAGLDGLWNDDFHHSGVVALTGRAEAYYTDYRGTPQEFVSAAKRGFLYQGQYYVWQHKRRGSAALDVNSCAFVTFLENHDQVANSARARRLHQQCHPGSYRALTAHLLLTPGTPMLFQGQEFCSTAPFYYFADHKPELSQQVRKGRAEFLAQFPSVSDPAVAGSLADPGSPSVFQESKLDWSQRERHQPCVALHRKLIELRRGHPILRHTLACRAIDGAVLGTHSYLLRYFGEQHGDALLVVNLGPELRLVPAPEPLLAAPAGTTWRLELSTEELAYGGSGAVHPEHEKSWLLPPYAAVFLVSHAGGEEQAH